MAYAELGAGKPDVDEDDAELGALMWSEWQAASLAHFEMMAALAKAWAKVHSKKHGRR